MAPQVVITTTCDATSDDKVGIMASPTISEWLSMNNRVPVNYLQYGNQGAVSIRKTVLPGMAIPMLKIRRPDGRLIFNMEIAIRS